MTRRYTVVEKRESLKELKENLEPGSPRKKVIDHRYDLSSFEGHVSFAPVQDDGLPDFWESIDIATNDRVEFDNYELAQTYLLTITEDQLA